MIVAVHPLPLNWRAVLRFPRAGTRVNKVAFDRAARLEQVTEVLAAVASHFARHRNGGWHPWHPFWTTPISGRARLAPAPLNIAMSHDPTPTRQRQQTETITMLWEESCGVLMDAAALTEQSTVMLDELHRLRAAAHVPEPSRPDDGEGTVDVRPGGVTE